MLVAEWLFYNGLVFVSVLAQSQSFVSVVTNSTDVDRPRCFQRRPIAVETDVGPPRRCVQHRWADVESNVVGQRSRTDDGDSNVVGPTLNSTSTDRR